MLTERLESHPDIACFGEVLAPGEPIWHPRAGISDVALSLREEDPAAFLNQTVWGQGLDCAAVGFKLLDVHFTGQLNALRTFFRSETAILPIFLTRRDLLAVYVSKMRVHRSLSAGAKYQDQVDASTPIPLDIKDLMTFLKINALWQDLLRQTFSDRVTLELVYEDLVSDPIDENNRVLDFLGASIRSLKHRTEKRSAGSTKDAILNLDQVRDALGSSQWSHLMPDY